MQKSAVILNLLVVGDWLKGSKNLEWSPVIVETYAVRALRMYIMYNLQALGNDLQVTKSGVEEFLPAATVMVVSVTASTTQG